VVKRRIVLPVLVLSLAAVGILTSRPPPPTGRTAFLGTGLSDEQVIALSANFAASGRSDPLLLDAPRARRFLRQFLSAYRPDKVTPIGSAPNGGEEVRREVGSWVGPLLEWGKGQPPDALWKLLFPKAETVVVCPPAPRRLLLHAACLAGAARAPLYVLHGGEGEETDLRRRLDSWGTRKVYAVGEALPAVRGLPSANVFPLPDERSVADACLVRQMEKGPVQTLVLANPADTTMGRVSMSSLAPLVALQRRGALLLTDDRGADAGAVIRAALKNPALRRAENLVIVADRRAVPPERRRNPLPGADQVIELEPPGPGPGEPFSFATGRLFHRDPAVIALTLAREQMLADSPGPRKALVVSNPGGGLPLLETISRNTAQEFENAGYETKALFERHANPALMRRLMPDADIFLWEGHLGTLMGYGVPFWQEPMRPSLVFLQSCLALTEPTAQALLDRGAVGVIGSPVRTYSATGGALTLAYFDAMFYDGESVGGSLRQAKNFLLAYAKLKEQRLGARSRFKGANVRSAWAFSLWGDPTLKLPRPSAPKDSRPVIRAEGFSNRIVLSLPEEHYPKVTTPRYQVTHWPNGRLAGLLTRQEGDPRKTLVPMVFAQVRLKAHGTKTPRLTSRVPADHWVFLWDRRLHTGYLLVRPRRRDQGTIRFGISWED
jgi:hypothetical protein